MKNTDSVVKMQIELTDVLEKMYNRVEGLIKKYCSDDGVIPNMPEYSIIVSDPCEYYRYYDTCIRMGDDIVYVMLSLSMVISSMQDIKNTKLTKHLSNEVTVLAGFRKFLDNNLERLKNYKFDLVELKRQITDRLKLLQSTSFHK
jgi:hypothetical protein